MALKHTLTFHPRNAPLKYMNLNQVLYTGHLIFPSIQIVFNNHDHDGQMVVDLDLGAQVLECHGSVMLVSEAHTLKVCVHVNPHVYASTWFLYAVIDLHSYVLLFSFTVN